MEQKTERMEEGNSTVSPQEFVKGLKSCLVEKNYARWENVEKYGLYKKIGNPAEVDFLARAPFQSVVRFVEDYKTDYESTEQLYLKKDNKEYAGRYKRGGCLQRTRTYEGKPFNVTLESPPFSDSHRNIWPGISESDELFLDYNVLISIYVDEQRERIVSELKRDQLLCGQFVKTALDLIDHSIKNNWGLCIPFTDFGPMIYDPTPKR